MLAGKFCKSTITIGLVIVGLMFTGCATGNSGLAYEKYKEGRPKPQIRQSGDKSIDSTNKKIASMYKETCTYLDDYIKYCDTHRYYVAFANDTEGMSQAEKRKYIEALPPEKRKKVKKAVESQKAMNWKSKIRRASRLLTESKGLVDSAKSNADKTGGFGLDAVKKARACKHSLSQINYTVKSLKFLTDQYRIMHRAGQTKIR